VTFLSGATKTERCMIERKPDDIIDEMECLLGENKRENTDEELGVMAKRHVENIRRQAGESFN